MEFAETLSSFLRKIRTSERFASERVMSLLQMILTSIMLLLLRVEKGGESLSNAIKT
jgi:hypothetical protein